jgi:diguanylate cyclase (GGDEF)-like protein
MRRRSQLPGWQTLPNLTCVPAENVGVSDNAPPQATHASGLHCASSRLMGEQSRIQSSANTASAEPPAWQSSTRTEIVEKDLPPLLRLNALKAVMKRTRGGAAVHLPVWVLIGWVTGIAQTQSLFFYVNAAFFAAALFFRLRLTWLVYASTNSIGAETMSRSFVVLYLVSSAQWGLVAAIVTHWPGFETAKVPIWLVTTGICAAGTNTLGVLQAVRVGLPAVLILPTMLLSLIAPSADLLFPMTGAVLLWIYVFDASRGIRLDYWNGALAGLELEKRALELQRLSTTDALTRICNRRHFDERLASEWSHASRQGNVITVMIVDIDHFKKINDGFGHGMGDRCIVAVADALRSGIGRPHDLLARYGGEEFAVLLPGTSAIAAHLLAESLRRRVSAIRFTDGTPEIALTCSIGICSVIVDGSTNPDQALTRADQALYSAKRSGRNRVVAWEEDAPGPREQSAGGEGLR